MNRKWRILIMLFMLGVAGASGFIARNAAATIAGGKHDFSIAYFSTARFQYYSEEPCIFCHTPHGANINTTYSTNPNNPANTGSGTTAPGGQFLWNRALPARTWQVYQSDTLNHNTSGGPGTLSLMCLSCHDGVGAMNVLLNYSGGQPGSAGIPENQFGDFPVGDPNIGPLNIGEAVCAGDECGSGGGELRNDHPIGFVYDSGLDSGLHTIGEMDSALQRRMAVTNNRMECSTCHDPHITNLGGNNFLVMSNTGSQMCLSCHKK